MITTIAFTMYPVTDMARSRKFYEDTLGLKLSRNLRDEWVEYDVGESTLAITTMDMNRTPGATGKELVLVQARGWVGEIMLLQSGLKRLMRMGSCEP